MRNFLDSKQTAKAVKITDLYPQELRASGKCLIGKCPFHDDSNNPNFRIYPDTNSFYCFRCGIGGDVIAYVRKLKDYSFTEAVGYLNKYPEKY